MGIYDRDYSRNDGMGFRPSRGFSGPRTWSANTWLIVSCIAVFMLNALLPISVEEFGPITYVSEEAKQLPKSELKIVWNKKGLSPEGFLFPAEFAETVAKVQGIENLLVQELGHVPTIEELANKAKMSTEEILRVQRISMYPNVIWQNDGQVIVVGSVQTQLMGILQKWGYFSTAKALISFNSTWGLTGFQFWRFITFQFLHADLMHLLFNMVGLFFFGMIVEQYLGSKRYLAFYLLCGIAGACMYLLLNSLGMLVKEFTNKEWVPFLLFNDKDTILVGASAGVYGVIMAAAYLMPHTKVLLFFVVPMKLRTLAYGIVAFSFFYVALAQPNTNAGGHAAHIGGAIAGFFFIRKPHLLHGFFDFLGRVDPTSRSNKARKTGAVRQPAKGSQRRGKVKEAEIDRILEKIHDKGLQSLTEKEKKMLREASKR